MAGTHLLLIVTLNIILKLETASAHAIGEVHSDLVVTKYGPDDDFYGENKQDNEEEPGWMRKTLMKFGKVASRVGNAMGTHTTKITSFVDKFCEIVKTIIPLLAAICHVGQFQFCAATNDAPTEFQSAISPERLDLNTPD